MSKLNEERLRLEDFTVVKMSPFKGFDEDINVAIPKVFDVQELTTLSGFLQSGDHCDVIVVAGIDQTHVLSHKVILSMASEYFRNILKTQHENNAAITIPEITGDVLIKMINFIYTGRINIKDDFLQVYKFSKIFHLTKLQSSCIKVLLELSECKLLNILKLASLLDDCLWNEYVYELLDISFMTIWKSDELQKLNIGQMKAILSRDTLHCDTENTVFEFLLHWQSVSVGREQYIMELLPLIRFAFLSPISIAERISIFNKHWDAFMYCVDAISWLNGKKYQEDFAKFNTTPRIYSSIQDNDDENSLHSVNHDVLVSQSTEYKSVESAKETKPVAFEEVIQKLSESASEQIDNSLCFEEQLVVQELTMIVNDTVESVEADNNVQHDERLSSAIESNMCIEPLVVEQQNNGFSYQHNFPEVSEVLADSTVSVDQKLSSLIQSEMSGNPLSVDQQNEEPLVLDKQISVFPSQPTVLEVSEILADSTKSVEVDQELPSTIESKMCGDPFSVDQQNMEPLVLDQQISVFPSQLTVPEVSEVLADSTKSVEVDQKLPSTIESKMCRDPFNVDQQNMEPLVFDQQISVFPSQLTVPEVSKVLADSTKSVEVDQKLPSTIESKMCVDPFSVDQQNVEPLVVNQQTDSQPILQQSSIPLNELKCAKSDKFSLNQIPSSCWNFVPPSEKSPVTEKKESVVKMLGASGSVASEKRHGLVISDNSIVWNKCGFYAYNDISGSWTPIFKTKIRNVLHIAEHKIVFNRTETHVSILNLEYDMAKYFETVAIPYKYTAICSIGIHLYFCGGLTRSDTATNDVYVLDVATKSVRVLPPMAVKRTAAKAISFQNCIYVMEGHNTKSKNRLLDVEKFDIQTSQWSIVPKLPEKCTNVIPFIHKNSLHILIRGMPNANAYNIYKLQDNKTWFFVKFIPNHIEVRSLVTMNDKMAIVDVSGFTYQLNTATNLWHKALRLPYN